MAYVNPYEKDEQARGQASGERSLAEIYGIDGQGETSAPAPAEEQTAVGTVRRVIHTVDDVKKQVAKGALSSIEGVADFVIGASSLFGSLPQVVMAAVSDDYRERVKQAIAYDVSGQWFNLADNVRERLLGSRFGQYSYQKEGGLLQQVEQGIGGMLPAVAVSVATAGLAAPAAAGGTAASAGTAAKAGMTAAKAGMTAAKAAKLAEAASLTTMGLGAAGQATQEAYNDGAGYASGLAYGAARGATEVATEKMLGGVTKAFTGGGMLPSVGRSVASTGVKRFIKEAAEEGVEEMVSELADPATRAIYRGKGAFLSYLDPETYKAVAEAGLVGAVTGGVFQGTVGAATGSSGRAADVAEVLSEVDTLEQKRRNLDTNGKLTAEVEGRLYEDIRANYRVLEEVLKKTAPEKRAALMEKNGLSGVFAEDGSLQPAFLAELDRRAAAGRSDSDGTGFDRRTVSLEAEADKVAAVLAKEGRTQFTDVDSLSKVGRENLKKVKRVMNVFYDVSGGAVGNFVIANESAADNAYYDTDSGYIVLGADVLEKGMDVTRKGVQSWFETVLHEATHGTEGTETWFYLAESLKQLEGGRYYNDMLKHLGNRGYLDGKAADIRAEAEKISRKLEKGEALTAKQEAFMRVYASEGVSIMAELALGNEHFARRLLDADASLVEKLLNRIADMKEALSRRKDAVAQEAFAEIVAAEEMFLEALAEKGWRFERGKIVGEGEKEREPRSSKKGANRPIQEQDLETYLKIGKTKHTRDKKEGMMRLGKKPILTSISEVQDFLSKVIHGKAAGEVRAFGFVGERLANEVKEKRSTLNIQDHYLEIVADDLREAYIRHHEPKEKGDIALSEQDFLDIPQYLNDFDGIIDVVTHKNRTQIHIYKETDDGFIKILTVVSGERNALQVTKLTGSSKEKFLNKYKKTGRNTGSPGSSSLDKEDSIFATRTRHTASVLPNDSIHDSEPIVNPSGEISSEKSAGEVKKSRKSGEEALGGKGIDKEEKGGYNRNKETEDKAEYDSWRWTRDYGIIEVSEMDDFYTKLASTEHGDTFARNKRGELIIPICPKTNKGHGIDRKLVYVNGSVDDFYISKVVVLNYDTESEISEIRKDILKYEESGTGDAVKYVAHLAGEGFISVYFRSDMQYNGQYTRGKGGYGGGKNGETNNRNSQSEYSGRRYGEKNKPIKRITFDFEKEIEITYYKDGSKSIKPFGKNVKKSRKTNPQEGKKAPAWEKSPSTKKYLGVEATERVAMIDDRAYGTTNITKAIDNVIAALQAEIDESVEVSQNKELVVRLSEWKKSSSVNELINKLKEAKTPQEKDAALDAVVDAVLADAYVKTIISDDSMTRAVETVNRLKPYRRNIDLSQTGVSKPIYQKWGKKGGIPLVEVMEDLPTAVRLTVPGDTVAVMQDVDKAYEAARQYIQINKSHKIQYFMGEADEALLRERMKEAFKADLTAKTSAEAVERLEKQYHKQLDRATNVYNFSHRMNTIFKLSLNMRDIKTGRFLNQSQPENHNILNRTLGQLCRVMNGGSLNKSCRKYFQQVYEWYEHDAKNYLKYDEKTGRGEYSPAIADKLKKIGESQSAFFTYEELGDIINIFQYFKHMTENYQKVWRNGKMVEAVPEAKKYVGIAIENQQLHQGKIDYIYRSFYTRLYGDPHMLVRYMDCYREGFYTTMFERLRQGCVASQVTLLRMNQKINEALEDPKDQKKRKKRNAERKDGVVKAASRDTKYFESLQTRTIQLHGGNMPVGKAISLWLTCKRDQAKSGLLENGYSFEGEGDKETGIRRVFGFTGDERVRDAEGNIKPEYQQMIQSMRDEIYAQLTEQDKRLIRVVEEIMNHDCKELKWKTDLALNGWSNAALEYYFPIRRYQTFTSIDSEGFFGEVDRVSNASFNKNTTPGAKNQLLIESVEVVLDRHMRGVAKYAGLAQVIRDYDTLRTLDISGNPNAAVSIATVETEKGGWHEGTEFFKKLLEDVQGIKPDSDEVTRFIGKLRGHYARAALSLNPKVIATQFSSVFAGMNIIDADCMARAFKDSGRDVFTYSELAELRASENTAAMAQGLLDEAGDFLMKPIGATDAWVVRRLFVACQYQVAKNNRHLGIGTEENKKAAAKLLDKVIFETQQNSLATEKSQAARSSSEFQKMMTMFTSDAVKGVGQLLDAIGEITVIRNEARVSGQTVDKIRLAKARRRAGRATVCLVSVAVYSAILAAGIKKLLDRDDEWGWGDFFSEVGAGLLGGLPWVKEIYDAFFGAGYGVEDMSVAAINDLMESITGGFNAMGSFVSGELSGHEAASAGRKLIYAIGNVVGLPARNTYTWGRRIVGILSQDAAYEMENFFKEQPYRSDIAKAIEAGDEGRLETVIGVMLDENVGEVTSSAVRQELNRLVLAGMDVLPRGVGDTVTVDGEAVTLTERQKKAFRAVYSEANRSVEKMVGLAYYAEASDEAKAKAIKRVYGIYYNRAIEDLLGVELENKNMLLAEAIDPEVLAVVLAVCGEIEADKDKDGQTVAGSKRRKIEDFVESLKLKAAQKFIIMGALGYKNRLGREKVEAYVKGLSLSSEEKEELMTIGGY